MEILSAQPCFDGLRPSGDGYATMPITEAFNWSDCATEETAGEWYMVAFRSVRLASADEERLRQHDDRAAEDAQGSPGYVHYYKGPLNQARECMSFCLWTSREEARAAAKHPPHIEAVSLIREMYERYTLEFWRVLKQPGTTSFVFEPYDLVAAA
jgi:heme-degrading monooxygenase HmoA